LIEAAGNRLSKPVGSTRSPPAFAVVDWGTTSFRLWLMDSVGTVLGERRSDEGMTKARNSGFQTILETHLCALGAPDDLPVMICGMAGARQGWIEARYIDTPAHLEEIIANAVTVPGLERDIRILPGLAQRDPANPDVIRGEETQLLGTPGLHRATGACCLPGTHSKWVSVEAGTIRRFSTFMTGELFAALSGATILRHALAQKDMSQENSPAFKRALISAHNEPTVFSHSLFTIRARSLLFESTPDDAAAFLSGLLIGMEMAGARDYVSGGSQPVTLIASGRLARLYALAFRTLAIAFTTIDAETAVRDGLRKAAGAIWNRTESETTI